jgi:indolepyruvate ferredoxin oxidoreductase beta subunit
VKADVVLAGVGGQGVLTVAAILAEAARREGLLVKQGEVHGMSQRGGAVFANLRIADGPIDSDLIPKGGATLLLGLEPLEALRYVEYLARGGTLLTAADPFENIPAYPEIAEIHRRIGEVPGSVIIEAAAIAKEAGSPRAANVVMAGAAATRLPLAPGTVAGCVGDWFATKGDRIVAVNLAALEAGRAAAAAGG